MNSLHLDWETRGVVDLREVGLHNYARDVGTDIWCAAYSFADEDPALWVPGQPCPPAIVEHVTNGGEIRAWNAPFEMELWREVAGPRYGWPVARDEQFFCSMACAYAMGLPGALEDAALALGLQILKDTEGRSLMLRMARPRSMLNGKPVWWDDADKLKRLYAYCQQDVRVERELHKRLLPLSAREREVWLLDYRINQRGVALDMPSVRGAIKLADAMKVTNDEKLAEITGGAVRTVAAVAAFKEWLAANGAAMESLAKQAVSDRLLVQEPPLDSRVRDALLLRQESAKSSVAKFDVMEKRAGADGRLRQMYQYHGAATGRWAGRGVQTANLPRDIPKAETVERILDLVRSGDHDAIDAIYGAPLTMASKCLRSFFVAPPGKKLAVGDWTAIEGRGQAWFAGEQWKLQAFRAADEGKGPGIYELAYSRMFNVPVESVKDPSEERQVGKVCELAFGYQGGVGSFHVMSKTYGVKVSDEKADEFKNAWRATHPKIKQCWYDIQRAAVDATRSPGAVFTCGHPSRLARFRVVGSFLWCLLPSGRAICFPYPRLLEGSRGPQLTYMTVPSQDDKRKGKVIADPKNSSNWVRVATYGGSLFNNIVQGFCRDILADAMLYLDSAGASIVLHTYDDIVLEVPAEKADAARGGLEKAMLTVPAWAAGFPLKAKPKVMARYGK